MTKRPTARAEPTEPLGFEAWWDSDPERKRFTPMSIARMAWQAASAHPPVAPVASKSVEDVMALADGMAESAGCAAYAKDKNSRDAFDREEDERRATLQAAIVAYGDAQWSAGRDAAAKEIEANNWPHYMAEVVRELKR